MKHYFLYYALYPEDWEVDTNELIKFWIAEGLVEEMDSMQKEIDKGYAIQMKLKNCCLIENNYKDIGRVKLHDIVRDMALRITTVRPQFLVKAGMQLKEIPDVQDWNEDLDKASFMENWGLQIPFHMPPPKCLKLTTLLLSKCYIQSIPECFFEQMHGLKILDLSENRIKSLPNSISNLETLTTLLLCWCKDLEYVPSFSKLQALKKLALGGTKIKVIPRGMERLVNLRYLDFRETNITKMADGILAKFTSLQHLAINNCGELFMRGEEIGGLRKLEFFTGRFYDLKEFNCYVQALHAQIRGHRQYFIYVGDGSSIGIEYGLEKIIALNCCNIICTVDDIKVPFDVEELIIKNCIVDLCEEIAFFSWFIPVPLNSFSSVSRILIMGCKNIKTLFSSNWVLKNLQNLEYLCVKDCKDLEEIIASELELEEQGISAFKFTLSKLCWLQLQDLPELKSICGANGVMVCDSIKVIDTRNCPKLKRIPLNLPFQDDGLPSPPSLTTISISSGEWWELVEQDHPNAKSLLQSCIYFCNLLLRRNV